MCRGPEPDATRAAARSNGNELLRRCNVHDQTLSVPRVRAEDVLASQVGHDLVRVRRLLAAGIRAIAGDARRRHRRWALRHRRRPKIGITVKLAPT